MKKYIIERAVTGIGKSDQKGLSDASHKSNDALAKLTPRIQWQESWTPPSTVFSCGTMVSEGRGAATARIGADQRREDRVPRRRAIVWLAQAAAVRADSQTARFML